VSWAGSAAAAVHTVTGGLSDLLLPQVCLTCGRDKVAEDGMCAACGRELLSLVSLPYCPRCGSTLGPNIPISEEGCPGCPTTLPRFGRAIRLGPYAGPLRSAVRQLKYRHSEAMRSRLGRFLAEAVTAKCPDERFDLVVAIPPHWRRRLARGCDHARVLAGAIARWLSVPVGQALIRVRHTPPQTSLSRTRRLENVRGAFAVSSRRAVAGANILLVDDVTTTGATASEAAKTLLAAEALRVTLAVIAKSEPPTAYAERLVC